jgi:hypothetical protein|tara:strand:- start:831 stop:1010 length:180 start_codon:yes stop_codon:yes gene_type:complete
MGFSLFDILMYATAAVTACSAIAAVTPTPKDDAAVAWAYKIIDMVALNFGKAKDTGTAE